MLAPAGKLERLIGVTGGFIAVGQAESDDGEGRPAVWESRLDGTWDLRTAFDRGVATTAAVRNDGILVFGFIRGRRAHRLVVFGNAAAKPGVSCPI